MQVPQELVDAGQTPKLTMQEKEDTLKQLKDDMWLGGDENEIFIGVRASTTETLTHEKCTKAVLFVPQVCKILKLIPDMLSL